MRVQQVLLAAILVSDAKGFVPSQSQSTAGAKQTLLHSIPNPLDTFSSGLASICRLPRGITATAGSNNDSNIKLLRLYDVENDRQCRAVRELITELDLTVDCLIPSTKNSRSRTDPTYQYALPDGASVPCLVARQGETTKTLSGSEAICSYLEQEFCITSKAFDDSTDTKQQVLQAITTAGSYVAGVFRIGRGTQVSPAASSGTAPNPIQPLILFSYENNQFCRLVREVLTELDLVYELRSAGKESPRRSELAQRSGGSTQCPFLVDPNTDTSLSESVDIIRYLYQQYSEWTPPNELLQWASETVLSLAKPVFGVLAPAQAGSFGDDADAYQLEIAQALAEIQATAKANPVVMYTYEWSPFPYEAKALLDNLGVAYKEVSLGREWIPGLTTSQGPITRAALLQSTGQSSLPHIFVGGTSIGGLYSGTPGLLPALQARTFMPMVQEATGKSSLSRATVS